MATGPGSVSPESRFSEETEVRGMRSLCICNKTDVDDGRLRLLEHDKDGGGRDPATKKSAKAGDAGMEVTVGREAIFAELGGNQCRRRNVTKDATEKSTDNKMVSFSDYKTKERFNSKITTTTTGNNITTTTTGKTALETTGTTASDGETGNNPDEKSPTITPQSGANGASPTPPSDDIAPMLCMQCRSPVGQKFVVPAKVNLLRCESKLDELIQKVDGHLRRLSTSLYEIVALEYALTQDGATGETIRKYGPLLLANRYDVTIFKIVILTCTVAYSWFHVMQNKNILVL